MGTSGFLRRLVGLFRRRRLQQDIDDELAFHLAMRESDHARDGRAEPARAARRQFGNVAVLKEQVHDMWRFPSAESLWQDVRYALRGLRRAPAFSVVALLVLGVGVGANVAMFSLVDAMYLRGLPYPDADRLVVLIGNVQRGVVERRGNSYPDHLDWRAHAKSFEGMAAYTTGTTTLFGGDEPERIPIEMVSPPYFSLLRAVPVQGRTFRPEEDDVPNRDFVVVLSDGLWRRRFNADPAILNQSILLGTRQFTVIGIMPPGFTGVSDTAQLWMPFLMSGVPVAQRGSRGFNTLARLGPGVTLDAAQAEMTVISKQLERSHPQTNEARGVEVTTLASLTYASLGDVVRALLIAVVFVLLIACANVANLVISRSDARQKEIALRAALGAGRGRILRQLLTESVVLTVLGAIGGLVLAELCIGAVLTASPVPFPSFVRPQLNWTVAGFTAGVAILCGLVVGLAPALHARTSRLTDTLKEGARGTSSLRTQFVRSGLVVAEVALAIVLLIGAGLMIRSVQKLAAIDPGFQTTDILTMRASIPRHPATTPAAASGAATQPTPPPPLVLSGRELLERVRAVPGVAAAALSSDVPLGGGGGAIFYGAEGDTTAGAQTMPRAYTHRVTPEFFDVMGIALTAGRTFEPREMTPDGTAVIVSEKVVRRFWPNDSGIGKRIKPGGPTSTAPWLTIVGVVGDLNYRGLPQNPTPDPDLFFPALESATPAVIIQTNVAADRVSGAVRDAIRRGHPGIVVYNVATLESLVDAQTAPSRFTTWTLGLFASAALILSVIGIYGIMSYLVAQRTREFGIRLALGASRGQIVSDVLRRGTWLIGIGLVLGVGGAFAAVRLLESLLFNVTAVDPSAAIAVAVLVVVAVVASAVPALRATRVDPLVALRAE